MVIIMPGLTGTDERVQEVVKVAKEAGVVPQVRVEQGREQAVTEVLLVDGPIVKSSDLPESIFLYLEGVQSVQRVTLPKVTPLPQNGEYQDHRREVRLGPTAVIGNGHPCLPIMGPCAIDPYIGEIAKRLADCGVKAMRGGAWKPRSSPQAFRGNGEKGVYWFMEALAENGMEAGFIEVLVPEHIEVVNRVKQEVGYQGTVGLWVGAHTQSTELLTALGSQQSSPVMIKNGKNDTGINGLITKAEWVLANHPRYDGYGRVLSRDDGERYFTNENLILCLRGLESVQPSVWRNRPNYEWAKTLRDHNCWAPICMDPSHVAGRQENLGKAFEMSLLFEPDALLIETGYPAQGFGDGFRGACDVAQSLPIEEVSAVLEMIATGK